MEPTAERIDLPEGYGKATTTMAWAAVRDKLEQAPRYWLVTPAATGGLTSSRSTASGWTTPGGTAAAPTPCTSATWSATSGWWSTWRTPWPR
jgi:hypothetical protein